MESPTLGYVDAMHQSLRTHVDRTVWTFYWALADGPPSKNRQLLLSYDWNYWKEAILHDLERVHHDIRQVRFANRHHAHGTRHGPPQNRRDLFARAPCPHQAAWTNSCSPTPT